MRAPWIYSFFFAFFFIFSSVAAQPAYFHNTANLLTTWTNIEASILSTNFSDGSRIRVILGIGDIPSFRCGFFCNGTCRSYLFAILITPVYYSQYPQVIWSANRDNPVRKGAILIFTTAGELVLHDVDGSVVWTTKTTGKSIAGMKLTDEGNLMLFDGRNSMVWQSFDHPTDCLVPGQKLFQGQKLIPSVVRGYNTSAFVKIQNVRSFSSSRKNNATVIGAATGSFVLLIVVVGFTTFIVQKQKRNSKTEEEYLNQVPGMPTRFSYEELKAATKNFSKKLGEGGFGSVFEGTLEDGSRIAVKYLQGLVHVKKSFTAEVESIGSIHHVNLVRLKGFSAWKSKRLLVYEFMTNGSLDQWIYSQDRMHVLEWECRKKIIIDIAKGLAYLHEECSQKIIHLDIKPQNILLDDDFNDKISDFGLSKLIDRDQSRQVRTTMRGTPGYMAPEWLSSFITEKVDVYSFGIVLLEILCGRKNFDRSLPEESWHLLRVFQSCWEQGTLFSILDRYSEDMQVHGTEFMEMMKVASWCLQTEFTKRPSMSSVVKVLEGGTNIESNLDYNFLYPRLQQITDDQEKSSKPVLPSILSGPRYRSGFVTKIRNRQPFDNFKALMFTNCSNEHVILSVQSISGYRS